MAVDSQSSPFSDIMLNIKNRLVQKTTVTSPYVRIVASDNYELYCHEEEFIYLRYYQPTFDTDASVGRRARRCWRLLRVYAYIRSSVDVVGDDELALTGQLGLSRLEEDIVDALDDYTPAAGSRKLTLEPLHLLNEGGPPERKPEDDIGICRSSLLFQIVYIPPTTPSDQYGT